MAKKAYRKAGRQTGLWVTCVLLGVTGQVGMVPLLTHWRGTQPDGWGFVLVLMPLIVMIVVAAVLSGRLQRTRRQ